MAAYVSELYVYPVKSMGGYSIDHGELSNTGLEYDRCWMVVDENARFVTQRQHPEMAAIATAVDSGGLHLTFPSGETVGAPILTEESGGVARTVVIWGATESAVDQGDEIAERLTAFLGRTVRLVYKSVREPRRLGSSYPSPPGIYVSFADSSPLHMIGQSSLDDLNTRLDAPVGINRFRPNIVVAGTTAFEEDRWRAVRVGGTVLTVVKDCIRCQMVNVDQQTGEKGIEPLETLGAYRSGPLGPRFGRKVVHNSIGTISVGDTVEIVESDLSGDGERGDL
jgi:uncharacterized protein YcbX